MKLTKQEALNLYNGLQAVSHLPGARWSYTVARNIALLTLEVQALQKAYRADEDFVKYESEREELAKKYAIKEGDEYKIVKVNGVDEYEIKDRESFNKEYEELRGKYKDVIDRRQEQLKDFEGILQESIGLTLETLAPDYIPQDITPQQLAAIMPIISSDVAVDKNETN